MGIAMSRVSKDEYVTLSLVSKLFRSIVASPQLYARRSSLGRTETCIYVPIRNGSTSNTRLYTLLRSSKCLVPIPSLPPLPSPDVGGLEEASYVVVGSRIFVMGGYYNRKFTSDVLVIDCGSNTVRHFCVMPKAVNDSVANVIDAKIYVVGGHYRDTENGSWSSNRMMVLDTETQTWECGEEN
ncbi:F-box/kelch-repeat protein At4g38940-like [Brassica napus]|uniref:F-box/kelch-repeat protein At4g38940-like n=1 Tax=Brassica napus TaxID=3708 RepID=UPI00207A837F|nr:F-box/kelch-repeat protein At4g38940-like [Brassica napus]